MYFIEFLRARRALSMLAIVLAAIYVIFAAIAINGRLHGEHMNVTVNDTDIIADTPHEFRAAGFGARLAVNGAVMSTAIPMFIMATILATTLNRERRHANFSFVWPVSRARLALGFIAVDSIALVGSFIALLVFIALTVVLSDRLPQVVADSSIIWAVALVFGLTAMWYGAIALATSWNDFSAGLVAGLSWPIFATLEGLRYASLAPPYAMVVRALDTINPFTYLRVPTPVFEARLSVMIPDSPYSVPVHVFVVWSIAVVLVTAAVAAFAKSEVRA